LIHRGMREELLKYFDTLYIMDLHGNALLKETTPEGEVDQNVFDIQQGVAILIAVREKSVPGYFSEIYKDRSGVKEMAKVLYYDLWGKRQAKYQFLQERSIDTVPWMELQPTAPNYFFAPKNFDFEDEYKDFWSVSEIFPVNSTGIKTHRDHFVMDFDIENLYKRIQDFRDLEIPNNKIINQYFLKDSSKSELLKNRETLANNQNWNKDFRICLYRPFDWRHYYHNEALVDRPRQEVMSHMIKSENLALIYMRQVAINDSFNHFFATNCIVDNRAFYSNKGIMILAPLYIYPNTKNNQTSLFIEKNPNLSPQFLDAIKTKLGYEPTPEAIFYYAYAIFHSPTYRQRYAEFLKIDFPRLPLTSNPDLFQALATEGEILVNLHLLKSEKLQTLITRYEGQGENQVTEVRYNENQQRVYINKNQSFVGIPPEIWQFKIGGYQVLEKWLKDRKKANRCLSPEEIIHYQKIVVALQETQRIMNKIDDIIPYFPIS
ncbi:MAG: type ISP restriction/modification enzyme, partial [Microcystaceae cyanobacterium]